MFGFPTKTWVLVAVCGSMLLWSVGCGGAQGTTDGQTAQVVPERFRNGNLPYDRVRIEAVDMNGDGRADQFYVHDASSGALRWVERDLNFDGRADVYEYFNADGVLIEREILLMHAERVTTIQFYRAGVLTRKEMDTGIMGSAPLRKYFDENGQLTRIERDSTYDGRLDVWEYFENGVLVRTGRDTTGDGAPDTFDRTGRAGASAAP